MTVIPNDFIHNHPTILRFNDIFFQKFLLWVILKYLSVVMKTFKTIVFCKNFIEGLFYLKPRKFIVDFFTNNI
jgi:hypothetical protein